MTIKTSSGTWNNLKKKGDDKKNCDSLILDIPSQLISLVQISKGLTSKSDAAIFSIELARPDSIHQEHIPKIHSPREGLDFPNTPSTPNSIDQSTNTTVMISSHEALYHNRKYCITDASVVFIIILPQILRFIVCNSIQWNLICDLDFCIANNEI